MEILVSRTRRSVTASLRAACVVLSTLAVSTPLIVMPEPAYANNGFNKFLSDVKGALGIKDKSKVRRRVARSTTVTRSLIPRTRPEPSMDQYHIAAQISSQTMQALALANAELEVSTDEEERKVVLASIEEMSTTLSNSQIRQQEIISALYSTDENQTFSLEVYEELNQLLGYRTFLGPNSDRAKSAMKNETQ